MNIKDILSEGEQVLFSGHEKRWAPGGKEVTPDEFYITTERIIIETNQWMGLKKDFQDIHYSDVMSIELKRNVWSSDIIVHSRFQGQVMLKAINKHDAEKIEQIVNEGINRYRFGYGGGGNSGPTGEPSTEKHGFWKK